MERKLGEGELLVKIILAYYLKGMIDKGVVKSKNEFMKLLKQGAIKEITHD